jgi:hypothetical protein
MPGLLPYLTLGRDLFVAMAPWLTGRDKDEPPWLDPIPLPEATKVKLRERAKAARELRATAVAKHSARTGGDK